MRTIESPNTLERYRRTAWEFQQTFQTPLDELPRFVDAIMSALPATEHATVAFDQIVFEPRYELVPLQAKARASGSPAACRESNRSRDKSAPSQSFVRLKAPCAPRP